MQPEIMDATLAHARALAATLRDEDRDEVEGFGLTPRHLLHRLWRDSTVRRSALVDGQVAAMWGLEGPLAAAEGYPWLLTSSALERVPFQFFAITARELAQMLETRNCLRTHVAASYTRAVRTFRLLGFRVGPPLPHGPHGKLYCQLSLERRRGI